MSVSSCNRMATTCRSCSRIILPYEGVSMRVEDGWAYRHISCPSALTRFQSPIEAKPQAPAAPIEQPPPGWRVNAYGGSCQVCYRAVRPREGWTTKRVLGWVVLHRGPCTVRLLADEAAGRERKVG